MDSFDPDDDFFDFLDMDEEDDDSMYTLDADDYFGMHFIGEEGESSLAYDDDLDNDYLRALLNDD